MGLFGKAVLQTAIAVTAMVLASQPASALTFETTSSSGQSDGASGYDDVQKRTPVDMMSSPIDDLRLPAEWPFDPVNALSLLNREDLSSKLQGDFFLTNGRAERCSQIGEAGASLNEMASCIETMSLEFYRSGSMDHFEPMLINMAKTDPLTYVTKADDFSPKRYSARSLMSVYGAFYAYYYDFFEFDEATRQLVDGYFLRKLTYLNMDAVGERRKQRFCNPRSPKKIGLKKNGRADINTCESNRWKATIAQLLLGMRLKDETLFNRGIYNTKFMLLLFDEEGIFVPWATRGALALHYSNEVPRFLTKLTEIYHALGYDFLEHELETGLTVRDLYGTYFRIYDDKDILNKYAKRRYAEKGESYSKYKKRSTADELRRWNLTKASFARESMRYITRYRPDLEELIVCDFSVRLADGEPQRLVSSFSAIDSYEFYLANFPDDRRSEEFCYQSVGGIREAKLEKLKSSGLTNKNGSWVVGENQEFIPGNWELTETVEPKQAGKSAKYRFRIKGAGDTINGELIRGGLTIYLNAEGSRTVGFGLQGLFTRNPSLKSAWQQTADKCGLFDDGEIDWIEVPIQTNWPELNAWFSCVVENVEEDGMLPVIRTLVFLGHHLDQTWN